MKPLCLFDNLFKSGLIALILATGLSACESKPKRFAYSPSTDTTTEIQNIDRELTDLKGQQAEVFSAGYYHKAEKSLAKAKSLKASGQSQKEVLSELGMAKAYLMEAGAITSQSTDAFPVLAESRASALSAGALQQDNKELKRADNLLVDRLRAARKKSNQMDEPDHSDLQRRYVAAEIEAIKETKLGPAKSVIASAKDLNAANLAPISWERANTAVKQTEIQIETDRSNDAEQSALAQKAKYEADRLLQVAQIVKNSNRKTSEASALTIVSQQERLQATERRLSQTERDLSMTEQEQLAAQATLAEREAALRNSQARSVESQRNLAALESANAAFEAAREKFSDDEAEVFRQGDRLTLRLKAIQFPINSNEIPSSASGTLQKVTEVMEMLPSQKVTVEGHTDSLGAADINKKLSQSRAESIAKYLTEQNAVDPDKVATVGYGYDKPISSNKSKEGRAQNRRVDIVIDTATESVE